MAKHLAHAVCMVLAFGLYFPSALAASVGWRSRPACFRAHRNLTLVGLLLAGIGLILAFCMTPAGSHLSHGHGRVGILVLLLALIQPAFSLACDTPAAGKDGSPTRHHAAWEVAHKLGGAFLLLCGACQVVSGYARWQGVELYAADGPSRLLGLLSERHAPHSLSAACCSMELVIALYFALVAVVLAGLSLGLLRSCRRGAPLLPDAAVPLAKEGAAPRSDAVEQV
jgi:uncharacterized membrane protein YidH (DUF202 family)